MEMKLKEQLNGIQHVGIPTNDIEKTIRFYETLGFEVAFQTVNEGADEKIAFLKLNTLVIETSGITMKQSFQEKFGIKQRRFA